MAEAWRTMEVIPYKSKEALFARSTVYKSKMMPPLFYIMGISKTLSTEVPFFKSKNNTKKKILISKNH